MKRFCTLSRLLSASFIALVLAVLSCATDPVTGSRQFMLVSEQDEIRIGKQTDREIAATYGMYDDKPLSDYVDGLGQTLAKESHRPTLAFTFKILDTPVVNAFAVPGGYVYLTRGILSYLNDEAELACVIGHEIGHITARHSAEQLTKAQFAQLGLSLGSILSQEFRALAGVAEFGVGMLFMKFSRDNEREADDLCQQQITGPYAVTLFVQAPMQTGKSSLVRRVLHQARKEHNTQVAFIDFQKFTDQYFREEEKFFVELCMMIGDAFGVPEAINQYWQGQRTSIINCSRYVSDHIIPSLKGSFILAMDEVERMVTCPFRSNWS